MIAQRVRLHALQAIRVIAEHDAEALTTQSLQAIRMQRARFVFHGLIHLHPEISKQ